MEFCLPKIRLWLVRQKVFFNRGYGIAGSLGIGYLVAAQLQFHIEAYFGVRLHLWWLFPAGVSSIWLAGWLEFKLGFFHTENQFNWDHNPAYRKLADKMGEPE
jgi:hypothetical protein